MSVRGERAIRRRVRPHIPIILNQDFQETIKRIHEKWDFVQPNMHPITRLDSERGKIKNQWDAFNALERIMFVDKYWFYKAVEDGRVVENQFLLDLNQAIVDLVHKNLILKREYLFNALYFNFVGLKGDYSKIEDSIVNRICKKNLFNEINEYKYSHEAKLDEAAIFIGLSTFYIRTSTSSSDLVRRIFLYDPAVQGKHMALEEWQKSIAPSLKSKHIYVDVTGLTLDDLELIWRLDIQNAKTQLGDIIKGQSGRPKGVKARHEIFDGMTWFEIRQYIKQHKGEAVRIENKYVNQVGGRNPKLRSKAMDTFRRQVLSPLGLTIRKRGRPQKRRLI